MEHLLDAIEDLTTRELKKFRLYLTEETLEGYKRISRGVLENADATDIISKMIAVYGSDGAMKMTLHILEKMNHYDLVERLERQMKNSASRVSNITGRVSEDSDVRRHHVSQQLKDTLRNEYASIFEGPEESKVQLDEIYTELHVTEGVREEVNTQHEVQQIKMQVKRQTGKDIIIKSNDIMNSSPGNKVRTVMTIGIAGIGKSVCVQKFCLDWAEGRANQDIHFIFLLPFRELNLLVSDQHSLLTLLLSFYPELVELNDVELYNNSKILFVFDGLDEGKIELDFSLNKKLHDLSKESSVGMLLTNLFQGHLLQTSQIWITSRPAAADKVPSRYIDKWTEVRGFNDTQKEEYFRKVIAHSCAEKIISDIKRRSSLYIMCHIPVFCWILVCVVREFINPECSMEIPTTMTELFVHFLLIQTNRKNQRHFGQSETDRKKLLNRHKEYILQLSELAFKQLEKGNILFSQKDLAECGIVDCDIEKFSGMCTQIFKTDHTFYKSKFYCFVHLSVQEFMAALYAFYNFATKNYNAFTNQAVDGVDQQEDRESSQQRCTLAETNFFQQNDPKERKNIIFFKRSGRSLRSFFKSNDPHKQNKLPMDSNKSNLCQDEMPLHVLLNGAVDKSLQFESGQYDLFLRFLLGITLESNQELLKGLLPQVETCSESLEKSIKYIEEILSQKNNSVDRCLNLLLCLLEMKNKSLSEKTEQCVISGQQLTPAQCSLHAYMLMMSEEVLDEFDLRIYNTCQEGRDRLLTVLRGCRKARLHGCGLREDSCGVIVSHLHCESTSLKQLDLNSNPLLDAGVACLSAGLKHTYCRLNTLRLAGCGLSEDSCRILSSVLQAESSQLRELDLSYNHLRDCGVELLSNGLKHSNCRLETLRLAHCQLTSCSCQTLASVLQSDTSQLKELDLSNNDLTDSGAEELCGTALRHLNCKLEVLSLSGCLLSLSVCEFLVSALTSNSGHHLTELDLSYNYLGDTGLEMLSTLDDGQVTINVENNSEAMLNKGIKKYACELTLDPYTAHRRLVLSEGNRKVTWVNEKQLYLAHACRFDVYPQVLSREPLPGRCYWEYEWTGQWADIGVAYESITRKGDWDDCGLGFSHKSWCLKHGNSRVVWHNKIKTELAAPLSGSRRGGVYVDTEAGTLSFYSISSDTHTLTHLHTFYTTFTDEPLYASFGLWPDSSVTLC